MIVLDASAAVEIAKCTHKGKAFCAMMTPDEEVVAPTLFSTEVTNIAWKHVHMGLYDKQTTKKLMRAMIAIPDRLVSTDQLLPDILATGIHLDYSVYDMAYFVLARWLDATLITCDKKLQQLCLDNGVDCTAETQI